MRRGVTCGTMAQVSKVCLVCGTGVELLFLEIKMPITSEDDLVQQFDDFFAQHTNIKIALIGKCQD